MELGDYALESEAVEFDRIGGVEGPLRRRKHSVIQCHLRSHRRRLMVPKFLEGNIYDFKELEKIDQGLLPTSSAEEFNIIGTENNNTGWDIDGMMVSKGVV